VPHYTYSMVQEPMPLNTIAVAVAWY